jgi:hypothetical protein
MTSTTRMPTIALAILALAVPAASATPIRDNGAQTSSLAGTTSAPKQDTRNADNRAPPSSRRRICAIPNRVPAHQPQTMKQVVIETQSAGVGRGHVAAGGYPAEPRAHRNARGGHPVRPQLAPARARRRGAA